MIESRFDGSFYLHSYHCGDILNVVSMEAIVLKKIITLYHGSENIVEVPVFGKGRRNNDFGLGFIARKAALAMEWAVSDLHDGYANRYTLDTEYLKVLHLNSPQYTILNWIVVLVEHRLFTLKNPVARRAKQYLIDNFAVNVNAYDIITGYRADDSYFDYAETFLNNGISVEQLARAMRLGKLGEQIVIKSKYAFPSCILKVITMLKKINTMISVAIEIKKLIGFMSRCWKKKAMVCICRIL